ncbi:MAG: pyridoxine 5'-phosphate synthase [Terrimicrobiaceae bacterium]|nr:pyridoxine 5'-phosphate synthase [Terrimicrobiaceae bacterium]
MIKLGVNIDHVATIRQARYRGMPDLANAEPDPVAAALAAERGGASGITAHLRADRRHIQDADIFRLREAIATKLNFEMGNTPEIIRIALRVKPEDACLVPENRAEVTTEGGLDCVANEAALRETVLALQDAGTCVSLFIDPDPEQIEAAARLGAECVELHTGAFANAVGGAQDEELLRLVAGAELADSFGLRVNAGHGINYTNVAKTLRIPHLVELNIGHSIVSRAVFVGIEQATREMAGLLGA